MSSYNLYSYAYRTYGTVGRYWYLRYLRYLRYRTVGTVGTYGRYHGTGKLVPSQSDTTYLASHIISWGSDLEVLLPPELQTC